LNIIQWGGIVNVEKILKWSILKFAELSFEIKLIAEILKPVWSLFPVSLFFVALYSIAWLQKEYL